MGEIKFRLAKPSDAKQIANCHWHVRDRYTEGIFLSLGERFLRAYYKIILDDPWEVVVCAENDEGKIVGFSSATLDAKKQVENLKKNKVRLGLSALGAILINPRLLKAVWQRYKSLSNDTDAPNFVHTEGVRSEYWCWLKEDDSLMSAEMGQALEHIVYDLGYKEWTYEVDKFNKQVYKYNLKVVKAEPIREIELPDGRVRVWFKTRLKSGK